jgi:hypothetical protein
VAALTGTQEPATKDGWTSEIPNFVDLLNDEILELSKRLTNADYAALTSRLHSSPFSLTGCYVTGKFLLSKQIILNMSDDDIRFFFNDFPMTRAPNVLKNIHAVYNACARYTHYLGPEEQAKTISYIFECLYKYATDAECTFDMHTPISRFQDETPVGLMTLELMDAVELSTKATPFFEWSVMHHICLHQIYRIPPTHASTGAKSKNTRAAVVKLVNAELLKWANNSAHRKECLLLCSDRSSSTIR